MTSFVSTFSLSLSKQAGRVCLWWWTCYDWRIFWWSVPPVFIASFNSRGKIHFFTEHLLFNQDLTHLMHSSSCDGIWWPHFHLCTLLTLNTVYFVHCLLWILFILNTVYFVHCVLYTFNLAHCLLCTLFTSYTVNFNFALC